jgi:hypothetical protein
VNEQWEMQCYGCLEKDLRASIENSLTFKHSGPGMIAMSMLSDAQEEIERNMNEQARQTINRAKWVIATYWMGVDQRRNGPPGTDPVAEALQVLVQTPGIRAHLEAHDPQALKQALAALGGNP